MLGQVKASRCAGVSRWSGKMRATWQKLMGDWDLMVGVEPRLQDFPSGNMSVPHLAVCLAKLGNHFAHERDQRLRELAGMRRD
eukprot:3378799-Alexandrium_andersonii.AAC.1